MKVSKPNKKGLIFATVGALLIPSVVASASDLDYYDSNNQKLNITNKSTVDFKKGQVVKPDVSLLPNQDFLTVGISGGTLSMRATQSQSGKPLDVVLGDEHVEVAIPFDNNITVTDTRATQEGWNLAISATRFSEVPKEGGKEPKGGWYSLPQGSIKLKNAPIVTSLSNAFETEIPSILDVNPTKGISIDKGEVILVSAFKAEGQGTWDIKLADNAITVMLSKSVLKQDKVNYPNGPTPYQTTITWTLSSGPGN